MAGRLLFTTRGRFGGRNGGIGTSELRNAERDLFHFRRRLSLVDQLRRALDLGEFVLHYQPVLRLSDSRMVGAEALLRWNHPSDGLVPPAAAELADLIGRGREKRKADPGMVFETTVLNGIHGHLEFRRGCGQRA